MFVTLGEHPSADELDALASTGLDVSVLGGGVASLTRPLSPPPAIFFLEALECEATTLRALRLLLRAAPGTPVIVLADRGDGVQTSARQAGAHDVMVRPLDARDLGRSITTALGGVPGQRPLGKALEEALARGTFRLHYQPIMDLESGMATGAEALLRWTDALFGEVPPLRFIPLAERLDLITAIDGWVAADVCRQLGAWRERGRGPTWVAINLSLPGLGADELATALERLCEEAALPPESLVLELNERVLSVDDARVHATLEELRAAGFRLAIDDFGITRTAISYLKRGPFDALKIDRLFVRGLPDNASDAELVKMIIRMAHGFGIRVIGEGVENADQLAFLRSHGCDLAQGRYIGPPLPAEDLEAYLAGSGS